MKKLEVVFYDIVKGYSRLIDDSIVYTTEEQKNEIIMSYIKRFGYTNVAVEDGTIIILRTRL
jgi:hypothetical protein